MSATANLNQEQMHHTRNLIHRMDDILGVCIVTQHACRTILAATHEWLHRPWHNPPSIYLLLCCQWRQPHLLLPWAPHEVGQQHGTGQVQLVEC